VPFGAHGVFSNEALINRINSDLANDLGNLVSRTVSMIDKYFGGTIPAEREEADIDKELKEVLLETPGKAEELLDKLQFSSALTEIWKAIARTNKYIDETMPWVLAKDESKRGRLATVLYNLAESIRIISILIQPFMPETPAKIWNQLGLSENSPEVEWDSARSWGIYPLNAKVNKGDVIFPRIDVKKELEELERINPNNASNVNNNEDSKRAENNGSNNSNNNQNNQANEISIEDFSKVDLKVAKVVEAEKVEGSDKLLKLKLEVGNEFRQVVSGISKFYNPDNIIGKYVILVANLKPVKIRGIESQGMILAASDEKDLSLITVDRDINTGTKVR